MLYHFAMGEKLKALTGQSRYNMLRVGQLLTCELILAAAVRLGFDSFDWAVFWPITLALIVPVIFTEPHFTAPRTAFINSAGLLAGYFSSNRTGDEFLWTFVAVLTGVVVLSALVAVLRSEQPGQLFHWIATRIGRAAVLGSVLTTVVLLQVAKSDPSAAVTLSVALFLVYGVLFLDWPRLFLGSSPFSARNATIASVFAPNQILVRSFGSFQTGTAVRVSGPKGKADGYIAEDFASNAGSQYRIVLDSHWRRVSDVADVTCTVDPVEASEGAPLGFAIEGSTESTIRLNPVADLSIGDTLYVNDSTGPLLYQAAGLRLEEETWSRSSALVSRAHLVQIGSVDENGYITARPYLPDPYEPVLQARAMSVEIDSARFFRIGTLKGTDISVGIRRDWTADHGHLAILGMSGMGKTSVATKLTGLATNNDKFVVLDETSEYRTRLGYTTTLVGSLDWSTSGVSVCEPGGQIASQCASIIQQVMSVAHAEYEASNTPMRRYLLLEEAHGYLPEWNFTTTKSESDKVNESCRYILQARKFNLTFVLVSQRTAVISKSAISQCENYIILRTIDQTSLDYIESLVGDEMKRVVAELGRHEAVCVGPIFNSDAPVIVKLDPPN